MCWPLRVAANRQVTVAATSPRLLVVEVDDQLRRTRVDSSASLRAHSNRADPSQWRRREAPMPILTKLREFLEHENVPYSAHSHPEAYTALEIAALEHVKGRMLAKVVIVKTGTGDLVMVVLPADRRVDLRKVGAVLGSEEVRLAQESEFRYTFPACDVGSMPPFGNLFGLPVLVDERLADNDEIVFNAGTHTLTAKLRFVDFRRLVQPRIASLSVPVG